ncbi:hypothetical protein AGMMS50239_37300 [Bacteroidia bacterium]|nr:hypothetical protein AGMMS50239_37300 [Bacteroidia bacterium]
MKRILFSLIVLTGLCASCKDQFQNITDHASKEAIYPGKFDFAVAKVGFERVEIDLLEAGRIPSSEIHLGKAKKTIVEYDDQVIVIDSVCSWLEIRNLTRPKLYRFKIYSADEFGNRSVPVETSATPYFEADLVRLSIPDPRVVLTSSGAQVSWPKSLLAVMMDHYGMTYNYADQDNILHEGTGGPNSSILIENVETGQEVTIDLVHKIVPKINEQPISDTVFLAQKVVLIIPQLSTRVNVALHKRVTESDFRNAGEDGSNAVDGVKAGGRRWVSKDNTEDHWLEIGLGAGYPIDGFQIWTGNGNDYSYPIAKFEFQVWIGSEWVDMVSATGNTSPTYFFNFTNVTTSKVRLLTHGQMIRLFEIEVYVTVTNPTMRVNTALYKPTTQSDFRKAGEEASKAVDGIKGNNDSRWVTANGNHWMEIDLVYPFAIDGFKMWQGATGENQPFKIFRFMAWVDGAWVTLYSATNNLDIALAVNFSPVTTTKVRLEVDGQEARLQEIEVYSTVQLIE